MTPRLELICYFSPIPHHRALGFGFFFFFTAGVTQAYMTVYAPRSQEKWVMRTDSLRLAERTATQHIATQLHLQLLMRSDAMQV
jgi:hypothetical protein